MSNAIRRSRERGGAGGRHKAALARLHSARVAQSRRRASLPGAGGRRLPLWGGAPPLKDAELDQSMRLYDLRHSCATLLLDAGINAKVVSERLGHSSVAFTLDTYGHVLPHQQNEATAAFASMMVDKKKAKRLASAR